MAVKRTVQADRPQEALGRRGLVARLLALVVLLGAAGMVGYAVGFHSLPVLAEQEVDMSGFAPPGMLPPGLPDLGPPGAEPEPFPAMMETVTLDESEPALVREVTYGGVARTSSGEIQRTYTGEPPSQCPT